MMHQLVRADQALIRAAAILDGCQGRLHPVDGLTAADRKLIDSALACLQVGRGELCRVLARLATGYDPEQGLTPGEIQALLCGQSTRP